MQKERRPVANYLMNRAEIEREHLLQIEQGNTELRTARFFLRISDTVRNSRLAVAGLLAGLATLVAIDVSMGEDMPEPLSDAMDVSQVVITGALLGAAARPVSRTVDMGLQLYDDFHLTRSLGKINPPLIHETESDATRLNQVRAILAQYGSDLSKNAPQKREVGDSTGNEDLDLIRGTLAQTLSHRKESKPLQSGRVEAYVERKKLNAEDRKNPNWDILDRLVDNLAEDSDFEFEEKKSHAPVLDGITLLYMESQVLSEQTKQHLNVLQKKAGVLVGDFAVGIGAMWGLITGASLVTGDDYKGLAFFADDAVSFLGIGLAPAFKKLFSTQTARDISFVVSEKASTIKNTIFQKIRHE